MLGIVLIDQLFYKKLTYETGFSLKSLIFGPFLHVYNGEYLFSILHVIATLGSFGAFWLVYPYFYNRKQIQKALERGCVPENEADLLRLGILYSPEICDHIAISRLGVHTKLP